MEEAGGGKRPLPDAPECAPEAKRLVDGSAPTQVRLSLKDKAQQVHITEDGLGAQSSKGYRMVRCNTGAASGAWYCEARVEHLGATGHARLGWATCSADLNAPVGYDKHGYGYRSGGGEKIHDARRELYGSGFAEGDVVGMYLCLCDAPGATPPEVVQLDGQRFRVAKDAAGAAAAPAAAGARRSAVAFAVNGVSQGVAFRDLAGDVFFAAASLFTEPTQAEPAAVVFNFGEQQFAFAPPLFGELPAPQPLAALAAPPPSPVAPAGAADRATRT